MATYNFLKAQVVVEYIAGENGDGMPIVKKKSFANIRPETTATQLQAVGQLFAQLSDFEVVGQQKIEHSQIN